MRRGRETVGDLDILVTGSACCSAAERAKAVQYVAKYPPLMDIIAQGDNKISFHLRSGMQVDVRLLPPESFGAAMQYFTGSKAHNVALRQRALKMGYTLNEYSLADLKTEKPVAGKTEEEIYAKLKLDYIPPELRENLGEIDAAEKHTLPSLITLEDLQGDVHMHTVETDGKNTIEEMAEAAKARGYKYMAITDHSKNLAFANGLDDKRAVVHIQTNSRGERRRSTASPSSPESKSIFSPMAISIFPTTYWPRWMWSLPACIRFSIRNRRR